MKVKEVIEKIKNTSAIETFMSETIWVKRDEVLDIIKRLDEPEKPVVSQFIDSWIQGAKYNGFDLYEAMTDDEMSDKVATWIVCHPETFAKAWLFGYEVEKEKLYTVEIPDPNASGYGKTYLAKNKNNKVELFNWGCYTSIEFADNWKQEENAQLTESEIKKDHAWAWQFAEEVEK